MRFQVTIDQSAFRAVITGRARRDIEDYLYDVRAKMIEGFGRAKSGRFYYRPKPARGRYRASAAGEAPAIRSGNLLRLISQPIELAPVTWELRIAAPYAELLNRPDKLNRPFVEPAVQAVTAEFNSTTSGFI